MPASLRYSDYLRAWQRDHPVDDTGGSPPPPLSEEEWNKLPERDRYMLVGNYGEGNSYWGYRLDESDPYVQDFIRRYGRTPDNIANSGFELGNERQTGWVMGYNNDDNGVAGPQFGRVDWRQLAIDPSRIMWLDPEGTPNRRYLIEASNMRGGAVANEQSRDSNTGLGDNAGVIMASIFLAAAGAGGAFEGLFGPGTTIPTDYLDAIDASFLDGVDLAGPQLNIPDLMPPGGGLPDWVPPEMLDTTNLLNPDKIPPSDITLPDLMDPLPDYTPPPMDAFDPDLLPPDWTNNPFGPDGGISPEEALRGDAWPWWKPIADLPWSNILRTLPGIAGALKPLLQNGGKPNGPGSPNLGGPGGTSTGSHAGTSTGGSVGHGAGAMSSLGGHDLAKALGLGGGGGGGLGGGVGAGTGMGARGHPLDTGENPYLRAKKLQEVLSLAEYLAGGHK